MMDNEDCSEVTTYDYHAQLKQVQSKFHEISTYTRCRASSNFTDDLLHRPVTVWILFDENSGQKKKNGQQQRSLLSTTNNGIGCIRREKR